jgi:hypothetical protein
MPQPIKAVSELISSAQRLWFRGGISRKGTGDLPGLRGKRRLQWNTRRIDLVVLLLRLLYRLLFLFGLLPQSLCYLGHSMWSSTGRHGSVDLSACESSKPSAYGAPPYPSRTSPLRCDCRPDRGRRSPSTTRNNAVMAREGHQRHRQLHPRIAAGLPKLPFRFPFSE